MFARIALEQAVRRRACEHKIVGSEMRNARALAQALDDTGVLSEPQWKDIQDFLAADHTRESDLAELERQLIGITALLSSEFAE